MLTAGAPAQRRPRRGADAAGGPAGARPRRAAAAARSAINRGHVFAGDFGPAFRRTYSVKGDAINLAARVMGKARARPGAGDGRGGGPLADRVPHHRAAAVPGQGQVAARAGGGGRGARRRRAPRTGPPVPLVGRARGAGRPRAGAGRRARSGTAGWSRSWARPGIGKSRLRRRAADRASRTCRSCARPLRAVRVVDGVLPVPPAAARRRWACPADADADEVAARLADRVAPTRRTCVPWLPLLGIPMDVPLPPTPETDGARRAVPQARLEAVVTELLGALLPTPTVLVVEDAHLMDDASADLLQRLAARLADRPWLVMVTRRETRTGSCRRRAARVTSLRPQPLDPDAALRARAGRARGPPAAGAGARRPGRARRRQPDLPGGAGARGCTRAGSLADLPESVEALVTSQIDRLDPADRTVAALRRGARHGGRRGGARAAARRARRRGADRCLRRLADFLVRERPRAGCGSATRSCRDVAYEGLPFSRRRILHDQVGHGDRAGVRAREPVRAAVAALLPRRPARPGLALLGAGRRAGAGEVRPRRGHRLLRARRRSPPAPRRSSSRLEVGRGARAAGRLALPASACPRTPRRGLRAGASARCAATRCGWPASSRRRRASTTGAAGSPRRCAGSPGGCAASRASTVGRPTWPGRCWPAATPTAASARAASTRRCTGPAWRPRRPRRPSTTTRWPRPTRCSTPSTRAPGARSRCPTAAWRCRPTRELGNLPRQGHCLNNLAVQAFTHGALERGARPATGEATDIFRRIGDTASEGNAIYNQAELLVRQRRYDEAAAAAAGRAPHRSRACEDDELVALALREQARTLRRGRATSTAAVALLRRDPRLGSSALERAVEVRGHRPGAGRGPARRRPHRRGRRVARPRRSIGAGTRIDALTAVHRLIGRHHARPRAASTRPG